MSSLCLQYRPKCWAEVIGQNTVVSILSRQAATKKWKNSYLFCGPHGCGKTTVARLFADNINEGNGFPIEIDAASNNGVDNIRQLIMDAQQSSLDCDYKVYIIDECHQLTKAAWDAALKLIEEPPSGVVFIFCTTNPNKLPGTILSRVQRFDFKRVPYKVISGRLAYILNTSSDVQYSQVALDRIAIRADGHVRDAIQLLDKCLDFIGDSNNLDVFNVEEALGLVNYESLINIVNGIIDGDLEFAVTAFNNIKSKECDMIRVFDDLIKYTLDCTLLSECHINLTTIPADLQPKIKVNRLLTELLLTRLVELRKYADNDNAEALIKTAIIEQCDN
jgi:DNA polymerase-3 subunit gamma/tau